MAGLEYETDLNGLSKAPRGKLPYIKDDNKIIADSTLIRLHIEDKYGYDFDAGLDMRQRGLAWAVEKMLENNLYWVVLSERWMHKGNFDFGPRIFFKAVPAPLRPFIIRFVKKKIRRDLAGQGSGLHSRIERHRLAITIIDHTAAILGSNNYIMGDNPCGADAFVFAILTGASVMGFDTPLINAVQAHANLVNYLARMQTRYLD
jgi:glutathione S-transferase